MLIDRYWSSEGSEAALAERVFRLILIGSANGCLNESRASNQSMLPCMRMRYIRKVARLFLGLSLLSHAL